MADVLTIGVSMKRIIEFSHGSHFEERERTAVRVQVRYCAEATIKGVFTRDSFGPTKVDVVKGSCAHAG